MRHDPEYHQLWFYFSLSLNTRHKLFTYDWLCTFTDIYTLGLTAILSEYFQGGSCSATPFVQLSWGSCSKQIFACSYFLFLCTNKGDRLELSFHSVQQHRKPQEDWRLLCDRTVSYSSWQYKHPPTFTPKADSVSISHPGLTGHACCTIMLCYSHVSLWLDLSTNAVQLLLVCVSL